MQGLQAGLDHDSISSLCDRHCGLRLRNIDRLPDHPAAHRAGFIGVKGHAAGMFIWGFSYALTWAFVPLELKFFWLKFMFVGVLMVPGLFLIFTLRITHRDNWVTFRNLSLLYIEPLLVLILVWIFPAIRLFSIEPLSGRLPHHADRARSRVLDQHRLFLRAHPFFVCPAGDHLSHRQFLLQKTIPDDPAGFHCSHLPSACTPTRGIISFSDPDFAPPIAFGISGIVYAYAIYRHRFMDLVPFARSLLIEKMGDGILVLDLQGRIVDINPAMKNFLDADPATFIGRNISDTLQLWNERTGHLLTGLETRTELRLPHKPSRYLDLRVTPLYDDDQNLSGRLIVFRDVTDRKEVEKDLRHAMDRMQTQLIEIGLLQSQLREQAIRDALTNLFNRRYLEETLERELARASRELYPLCIVMMDIDHFKNVNDTYGHEAGDLVLKTLADTVTTRSRQGDFVCRYGGEEFVLVMPNIGIEVARERVNSLHRSIASQYIPFGHFNLNITMSMGIALYPKHGDTKELLLRAADRALYTAKNSGRNRVIIFGETGKRGE
jgi:diguanylate cyclase (GGDEF)-like protein/PAS domain S-box-containing protein